MSDEKQTLQKLLKDLKEKHAALKDAIMKFDLIHDKRGAMWVRLFEHCDHVEHDLKCLISLSLEGEE